MIDIAFFSVAAVALVATVSKACDLHRGPRRPGQLSLCLLLAMLGLAFVLLSDTAQGVESRIFPNLGRLLSNVCTILAALGFVSHLLSLNYPPDRARRMIRRSIVIYAVGIAVMVGMFLSTAVPARVGGLGHLYAESPALAVYIDIYIVLFVKAMVDLMIISVRCVRYARRSMLRLGLGIVAVGSVVALAYILEKALFVQSQVFGFSSPVAGEGGPCASLVSPLGCLFSVTFPVMAVLLIVVGVTLPMWGPVLAAPVRSVKDRRLYRRLGPLWLMLCEAFPQIVMPSAADLGPRWKLQRRVIEIHDGLLALSPYRAPGLREAVTAAAERAELGDERQATVIEAALIVSTLQAYRGGASAGVNEETTSLGGDSADLTGEACRLATIAEAMPIGLTLREQIRV